LPSLQIVRFRNIDFMHWFLK